METKELPKRYKTWYMFWKELEKNGLTGEHIITYSETSAFVSVGIYRYNISYIKDQLLKELLESRDKVQEFTFNDLLAIERGLQSPGYLNLNSDEVLHRKIKSAMDYLYEAERLIS